MSARSILIGVSSGASNHTGHYDLGRVIMFKIPMWRADKRNVTFNAPLGKVALSPEETGEHAETSPLPPAIAATPPEEKTPAQWAYERLILYIQNFEKTLDDAHEVGLGFVSGGAGVIRITGMGYFAPDLVSFYGVDQEARKRSWCNMSAS